MSSPGASLGATLKRSRSVGSLQSADSPPAREAKSRNSMSEICQISTQSLNDLDKRSLKNVERSPPGKSMASFGDAESITNDKQQISSKNPTPVSSPLYQKLMKQKV